MPNSIPEPRLPFCSTVPSSGKPLLISLSCPSHTLSGLQGEGGCSVGTEPLPHSPLLTSSTPVPSGHLMVGQIGLVLQEKLEMFS